MSISKLLLLFTLLNSCIWAKSHLDIKENAPKRKGTYTWGMGAGVVQGSGGSLRHWGEGDNGFQITLFPYFIKENDKMDIIISFGANWLHSLWDGHTYRFFGFSSRNTVYSYLGAAIHYYRDENDNDGSTDLDIDAFYNVGGGLGLQMNIKWLQLSLGFGMIGGLQYSEYDESSVYRHVVHPSAEINLGYSFGI